MIKKLIIGFVFLILILGVLAVEDVVESTDIVEQPIQDVSEPITEQPESGDALIEFDYYENFVSLETLESAVWIPQNRVPGEKYPLVVMLHGLAIQKEPYWFSELRDVRPILKDLSSKGLIQDVLVAAPNSPPVDSFDALFNDFNLGAFVDQVNEVVKNEKEIEVDYDQIILIAEAEAGCNPVGGMVTALKTGLNVNLKALGLGNTCPATYKEVADMLKGVKVLIGVEEGAKNFGDLEKKDCWPDVDTNVQKKKCYEKGSVRSYDGDSDQDVFMSDALTMAVFKELLLEIFGIKKQEVVAQQYTSTTTTQLVQQLTGANVAGAVPYIIKAKALLAKYNVDVFDFIKSTIRNYVIKVDECLDEGLEVEDCADRETYRLDSLSGFGLSQLNPESCVEKEQWQSFDLYSKVRSCVASAGVQCKCEVDTELSFSGKSTISFSNTEQGLVLGTVGYSATLSGLKFGYLDFNEGLSYNLKDSGTVEWEYGLIDSIKFDNEPISELVFVRNGDKVYVVKENSLAHVNNLTSCEPAKDLLNVFCFEDETNKFILKDSGPEPLMYKFAVQLGSRAPEPVDLDKFDVLVDDSRTVLTWSPVPRAKTYSVYFSGKNVSVENMEKVYPSESSSLVVYDETGIDFNNLDNQIQNSGLKEIKTNFDFGDSCMIKDGFCSEYEFLPNVLYFNGEQYFYLVNSGFYAVKSEDKQGNAMDEVEVLNASAVDDLAPGDVNDILFVYDDSSNSLDVGFTLPSFNEDGSTNEDSEFNLDFIFKASGSECYFEMKDMAGTYLTDHITVKVSDGINSLNSGAEYSALKGKVAEIYNSDEVYCLAVVAKDLNGNLPFGSVKAQEFASENPERYSGFVYSLKREGEKLIAEWNGV